MFCSLIISVSFFFIFKAREWLYFILSYEVKSLFLNFLNFFSNKGYRFMVFNNNTSQPSQTSFFESPLYERSYEGHNICVRFRYLIYGPGRHFLRIYQQLNLTDYPRRLVWAVSESNNTDLIWKYGRVALPSVTKYKVMKNKSPHNLFVVFSQGSRRGHLALFLFINHAYICTWIHTHTHTHTPTYTHTHTHIHTYFLPIFSLSAPILQVNRVS